MMFTIRTIYLNVFFFFIYTYTLFRILQRTSISTNIKERLDFSCAVFGPDGGLVSNAPHIPVHLGAMQETVQYQMKAFKGKFTRGDVILSNHPSAGGSHLPDLTVITPVFYRQVIDHRYSNLQSNIYKEFNSVTICDEINFTGMWNTRYFLLPVVVIMLI